MATKTVSTATCDACSAKETLQSKETLPYNWIHINLRRRVMETSWHGYEVDLCLDCQGKAVEALDLEA